MTLQPFWIVDDTPSNVELVKAILGGEGFRRLAAYDGPHISPIES
jgi:CheY-like chemotaxis protein